MGYRTYFNLDVSREATVDGELFLRDLESDEANKIIAQLRDECKDASYAFGDDGSSATELSWDDHDKHLMEFSKKFPDIVFTLHGMGDSDDDRWVYYYKNGQVCGGPAEIVYPDYDPKKLSEEVDA